MSEGIKLTASASYLPERVVTNDELSEIMDTTDEWIQAHTGIKTRHYAIDEDSSEMATKVALKLLKEANVDAKDIDLIILSTISPDALTPSTAALVQKNIGASNAFAYDLSAACAGFIFGYSTADKFLHSAQYNKAMVISVENNSKMMDFKDRTSAVFFGDGAAGVLLEKEPNSSDTLLAEKMCTDGDMGSVNSGRIKPLSKISSENYPQAKAFYQNGPAVFNFVTSTVIDHMKEFMKQNNVKPDDIDLVIPHQANLRLLEKISEGLNIPFEKFAVNVDYAGNTSSVGIPLALDEELKKGNKPKKALLTGFGAGLVYGSLLLDLS
ncbi:beta-ketoacyl-ACP synthase III [Ligilactobacillus cholophilus]|uniref:beta-ketoacyl-ACP synthase III n=1 Tax=Ligilactobacillus cholophilus TaxID=3050131 RepID=UPI0025B05781|nr:beta-ketoacyl-ACP synthase III [Ligilactobacillus cholophilus]